VSRYFQLPANERICSADVWPDVEVKHNGGALNMSYKTMGDGLLTKHGLRSKQLKPCA